MSNPSGNLPFNIKYRRVATSAGRNRSRSRSRSRSASRRNRSRNARRWSWFNRPASRLATPASETTPLLQNDLLLLPVVEEQQTTTVVSPIVYRKTPHNKDTTVDSNHSDDEGEDKKLPEEECAEKKDGAEQVESENEQKKSSPNFAASGMRFRCQLANGSPIAVLDIQENIRSIYKSMAEALHIVMEDIVFVTRNTPNMDMTKLFNGSLDAGDMLYVHVQGQALEVELCKPNGIIGITITDNGVGKSFIKRFHSDSVASKMSPPMCVGMAIEAVAGQSCLGKPHYAVAKILRDIPPNTTFTIRLRSIEVFGLGMLKPRNPKRAAASTTTDATLGNGHGTVRYRSDGKAVIEEAPLNAVMIDRLNEVIDSYLGLQDDRLAAELWEKMEACSDYRQMKQAVLQSSLAVFEFPDELIFDCWGIMTDWKRKAQAPTPSATSTQAL